MRLAHPSEKAAFEPAITELPRVLRDILTKARTSWLRNQEVVDLLSRHRQYGFRVSKEPPQKPPGANNPLSGMPSVGCFINMLIRAQAVFDCSMTSADCCRLTHACATACRGLPLPF